MIKLTKQQKRDNKTAQILKLRKELGRVSLIAKKMKVTPQAISLHQKLYFTAKQKSLYVKLKPVSIRKKELLPFKCPVCKTVKMVLPSYFKNSRKTCSTKCMRVNRTRWLGVPSRIKGDARWNWLYKHNPYYKKFHAQQMIRWHQNLKKDPVKYRKHLDRQAVYIKRYQERKKYGVAKTKLPEIF